MGGGTMTGGGERVWGPEKPANEDLQSHGEQPSDAERKTRVAPRRLKRAALLVTGGLVVGAALSHQINESLQRDTIDAMEAEKQTLLALNQAGYNNITALETQDNGSMQVTLQHDLTDPQSCALSFNVEGVGLPNSENENLQIILPRTDAAGVQYREIITRSPEETHALMVEECR